MEEQAAAAADVLAEANISWAADFATDHQFWEQLMMDGLGQIPLDFGARTMPGMLRTTDETMTMSSMIDTPVTFELCKQSVKNTTRDTR